MFQALGTFLPRSAGLRLAVAFAAIIILAGSLFLYLDGQRLRAAVQAEAERHGTFLFSTISQQFSDSLYFDDIEQIRKDAESLSLREEVTRIAVFTTEGKYLLDSDQYKVPGGNIDDDLLELVMTHREPLSRLVGDKLQFVGGVETDNRLLGGLYFELDLTERLKVADDSIRDRSLLGLVIVLLASGLAFAIAAASGTARSLRTIESNYKELIEQSPLPNAVFTTDGKLRYANPAFVKLMERSSHFSWLKYDIFTDPSLQAGNVISMIRQGFENGAVSIPAFLYPARKGSEDFWVSAVVFPLRNEAGEVNEVVVTFQDVTAEKQTEEERERFNALLLQSQKLEGLGVMAGGIAHDFNNYLTPIQGYADILSKLLSEDQKPFADHIIKAASRAAELCQQLLTYAGKDPQAETVTSISDEVRDMSELLRTSLSKKAVLEQSLADDLPSVLLDQTQLRQILQNLIVNASESLEGEVGHISLRTGIAHIAAEEAQNLLPAQSRQAGDYVYLEVADTGVGMSTETIENIFNPFYTTKFTGRGLGLSAVLGIVGNMGAGIKVESEIEKGTAFTIFFPATETLESESEISSPLHYESRQYTGDVLLVDDEEDVLLVGKHILKSLGFKVTVARNGAHALDEFRKHPDSFRCIVLDLMMPVMDGEDALKEIRKIDENVPVVVVTGYSGTESSTRLGLKPHVTVLPKPYLIDDMVKALASVLTPK